MENREITKSSLFLRVTSPENIYKAIYSVGSYVFEPNLLSKSDRELLGQLTDKYNDELNKSVISTCKSELEKIFTDPNYFFTANIYFKAKKYNDKTEKIDFRPLHTASLITQICIVCMLSCIMFDDGNTGRKLSNISALLPNNFYGNMPSTSLDELFVDWRYSYKKYTQDIEDMYHQCIETGEHTCQIRLDLKNFFPSINPIIVFKMIVNRMQVEYTEVEYKTLQRLVYKLLFFQLDKNLSNYEISQYYELSGIQNIDHSVTPFVAGIPQGLPQAYFFGNICMAEIAKVYEKYYQGKSYYYVDDSVIYTTKNMDEKVFSNSIEELNHDIESLLNKFIDESVLPYKNPNIGYWQKTIPYKVIVHGDTKSSFERISVENKSSGKGYLRNVARDASRIGFEFHTTSSELEKFTLKEKIEVWLTGVESEIERVQNDAESIGLKNVDGYLKDLKRYQKFFKYRLKAIDLSVTDSDISLLIKQAIQKYTAWLQLSSKELMQKLDAEILLLEASMLVQMAGDQAKKDEIKKLVAKLESALFDNDISKGHLYYGTSTANIFSVDSDVLYRSLKKAAKLKHSASRKNTERSELAELEKLLSSFQGGHAELDIPDYARYVFEHAKTYSRRIINTLISNVISVDLSDAACFSKRNGYTIKYFELRLLMWVRNKHFNLTRDISSLLSIVRDTKANMAGKEKIDYSIVEVLDYFRRYVKKPISVDQLILTHQYVAGIWRNGSKFLYFYTLHGQEHSVELIKLSISITKTVDYFQLKESDYFILFLACYLHDIAMVFYPNLSDYAKNGFRSNEIYTRWKSDVKRIHDEFGSNLDHAPMAEVKHIILKYFKNIDAFFEANIRNSHALNSAKLIRNTSGIDFLDIAIRTLVAEVSEAHGYNTVDVYGLKSTAKDHPVSTKYMMIILRLADLFDMTKDRVSLALLKQNIRNMPEESRFHWISHAVVEKCTFESKYRYKKIASGNRTSESALFPDRFIEELTVNIYMNAKVISSVSVEKECDDYRAKLNSTNSAITIQPRANTKSKGCATCIFACKWMKEKNNYLFSELLALKQYLERNSSNLFNTSFKVNLVFENEVPLEADFMDCVRAKLD